MACLVDAEPGASETLLVRCRVTVNRVIGSTASAQALLKEWKNYMVVKNPHFPSQLNPFKQQNSIDTVLQKASTVLCILPYKESFNSNL